MNDTSSSYAQRSPGIHGRHNDLAVASGEGSNTTSIPSVKSVEGQGLGEKQKRKRVRAKAPQEEHLHTPWLNLLPVRQYDSVEQRLHNEIVAYMDYMLPTPQEVMARQKVISCITKVIKKRFPDGEVKVYGSTATGLYLPTSDIDIVVSTREFGEDIKKPLFQLSAMLKGARLTRDIQVIHRAKVPILTCTTLPEYGSFNVDIGINNVDGLQGISIIKNYLESMPALHPLTLVVKGFLSQRGLNNAAESGLGSYAVICMCISFLQLNPSKRPTAFITNPREAESFGALLTDFLFYYGINFPYSTSYISVTNGKLLPKDSADWINRKIPDRLAIQCLVHLENDVGKPTGRIDAIRTAFKKGYATILQLSVDDTNTLGSLVSLPQSTLDHRSHIQHIVSSGELDSTISPPPRFPAHHGLPARPPPTGPWSTLPPVPPDIGKIPYGTAFGAGSSMGRRHYEGDYRRRGYNRKGSGFGGSMNGQSQVISSEDGVNSTFGTGDQSKERNHGKRRRLVDRLS